MDKHSSLFQTFLNYGAEKFYKIGPWSWGFDPLSWGKRYKYFYDNKLRIFIIS
jgi:hypothetical protein